MASVRVIGGGMTTRLTIVLCLCMINASMGDRELDDNKLNPKSDAEVLREMGQLLRGVESLMNVNAECSCTGAVCKCCRGIKIWKFKREGCVDLEYNAESSSFKTNVRFGSRTVFTGDISISSQEPTCFKRFRINFCLVLSDVKKQEGKVHACLAVTANIGRLKAKIQMGCFDVTQPSPGEMTKTNQLLYLLAAPLPGETGKVIDLGNDWIDGGSDDPFPVDDDEWQMVVVKKPLID